MSKAFTKEDVDPPERSGRVRSASGLPPGAINYITTRGAQRLREKLSELQRAHGRNDEKVVELEALLASVTIVEPPEEESREVAFGAAVTWRDAEGAEETWRVVGVDEMEFETDAISWISADGKTLLAAKVGERVTLEDGRVVTILKAEPPPAQ